MNAEFLSALQRHCLTVAVDELPTGYARVGTKLTYPDGSGIDVFLTEDAEALFDDMLLTDCGQTFAKLAEYGINYATREESVRDAIGALRVVPRGDQLVISVPDLATVTDAVINLAQTCLRVSCLAFSRRTSERKQRFASQVDHALRATGLRLEERHDYDGPFNRPVRVDYRVSTSLKGPRAAVLKLGASHTQANEVFRKWSDLKRAKVRDRLVTVYDDTAERDHPEDIERLEDISQVVGVSNQEGLNRVLRAA